MASTLREWGGIARSLAIYRARPAHARGLDALYAGFVGKGDLVFDVGAHLGDRLAAFRRLGARVVALEPNGRLFAVLKRLHGRDRDTVLVKAAAGAAPGTATLRLNRANPTVSTLSDAFVAGAAGAKGWDGQLWDAAEEVPVVTLDGLVAEHGMPAFVKIDAEGFEPEILEGLATPPRALSFEITTMARAPGLAALARCRALGYDRFRFSRGESHRLEGEDWIDGEAMAAVLEALPDEANSGDVYARLGD